MNRQTILAAIHRQLRESLAESGQLRPLGEVVGLVAEEIRSSPNGQVATGVIPIETVAAFVDGDLSEEESAAVCQAVMVDNSVLAELVSAVRARGQSAEELEPLPDVLRSQLMAMQSSLPATAATQSMDDDLPIAEEPRETPAETIIRTEQAVARSAVRQSKRSNTRRVIAVLLSVAAALALVIFWVSRDQNLDPGQPDIVKNDPIEPPTIEMVAPESNDESQIQIVDSSNQPKPPEPVPPTIQPELDPSPVVAQQESPVLMDRPPIVQPVPGPSVPAPDPPKPNPYNLAKATELSALRWTKMTGVVTRANVLATTSAARGAMWESIAVGPSDSIAGSNRPLALRTLPLSRAEATLESGGRVVLAADSGMEVSKGDESTSAEIRLQYGDVALIDLPKGTLIRLIKAGHPLAVLRWQSKASAVLQHAAGGLEVHVRRGTIDINEQPQKDSSVAIGRDRTITSIQHPKRQPAWVDRPVETINVKQAFLAQIGESRNVMGTLNQQIHNLTQNPRATENDLRQLATLASWQAALAGENVYRLAASHTPVVRLAALNRIATTPRWDPRYQRTWAAIERTARDKQRVVRFRRLMFLAQQNGAPSAAQINSMLGDLTAPDVASRAMSDYLLRRFHAKAAKRLPNYDPTWTGQAQTRGANQWRAYFGRGAANALQPAAAVDRLRN